MIGCIGRSGPTGEPRRRGLLTLETSALSPIAIPTERSAAAAKGPALKPR